MKLQSGKKIPNNCVKAVGVFIFAGSMTYEQIAKWAQKFYNIKLSYADIAEIEERIKNGK